MIGDPAQSEHRPDCILSYIHLLYIKRVDRQIVLRFSMAEVRINASTNELCHRLTPGFPRQP